MEINNTEASVCHRLINKDFSLLKQTCNKFSLPEWFKYALDNSVSLYLVSNDQSAASECHRLQMKTSITLISIQ